MRLSYLQGKGWQEESLKNCETSNISIWDLLAKNFVWNEWAKGTDVEKKGIIIEIFFDDTSKWLYTHKQLSRYHIPMG